MIGIVLAYFAAMSGPATPLTQINVIMLLVKVVMLNAISYESKIQFLADIYGINL